MEKEQKIEDKNIMGLVHSYQNIIDMEMKKLKKIEKYITSDKNKENKKQIKKHFKDAEKVLNEVTSDYLDIAFENITPLKKIDVLGSPLKIRQDHITIYGFPHRLEKYLEKDDWYLFDEYINKACFQVIKNYIKGHEKKGDRKYLPFDIVVLANYQVSGSFDRVHYPILMKSKHLLKGD